MQFTSPQESANLLAQKIREENFQNSFLAYINPDTRDYCQSIANQLNLPLHLLETTISKHLQITPNHIVILDNGSTRAGEYAEFTDYLRHHFPQSNIIIAIPFLPASEEDQFKQLSDSLITLHIEPLFFSVSQFYQNP